MLRRNLPQHPGQSPDVIRVGMGGDHIVQGSDPLPLQILYHRVPGFLLSGVNENLRFAAPDQGTVPLPHIDKMHGQGAFRRGSPGSAALPDQIAQQQTQDQQNRQPDGQRRTQRLPLRSVPFPFRHFCPSFLLRFLSAAGILRAGSSGATRQSGPVPMRSRLPAFFNAASTSTLFLG